MPGLFAYSGEMALELQSWPPEVISFVTVWLQPSEWFHLWLTGCKPLIARMCHGGVKHFVHSYDDRHSRAHWPTVIRELKSLESLSLSYLYSKHNARQWSGAQDAARPMIKAVNLSMIPTTVRRLELDIDSQLSTFPPWWHAQVDSATDPNTPGSAPSPKKQDEGIAIFPRLEILSVSGRFSHELVESGFPSSLTSVRLDIMANTSRLQPIIESLPSTLLELNITTRPWDFKIEARLFPRSLTAIYSPHLFAGEPEQYGPDLPPHLRIFHVGMLSDLELDALLPCLPPSITRLLHLPDYINERTMRLLPRSLTMLDSTSEPVAFDHTMSSLLPPALTLLNLGPVTPAVAELAPFRHLKSLTCNAWLHTLRSQHSPEEIDPTIANSEVFSPTSPQPSEVVAVLPGLTSLTLIGGSVTPEFAAALPPGLTSLYSLFARGGEVFRNLPRGLTHLHMMDLDDLQVPTWRFPTVQNPTLRAAWLPPTLTVLELGPFCSDGPEWYRQLPPTLKVLVVGVETVSSADLDAISSTLTVLTQLTFLFIRRHPKEAYGDLFKCIPRALTSFKIIKVKRSGLAGLNYKSDDISDDQLAQLPRLLQVFDVPVQEKELMRCLTYLGIHMRPADLPRLHPTSHTSNVFTDTRPHGLWLD